MIAEVGKLLCDVGIAVSEFVRVQRRAARARLALPARGADPRHARAARRMVGRREGWSNGMVPVQLRASRGGKTCVYL